MNINVYADSIDNYVLYLERWYIVYVDSPNNHVDYFESIPILYQSPNNHVEYLDSSVKIIPI